MFTRFTFCVYLVVYKIFTEFFYKFQVCIQLRTSLVALFLPWVLWWEKTSFYSAWEYLYLTDLKINFLFIAHLCKTFTSFGGSIPSPMPTG